MMKGLPQEAQDSLGKADAPSRLDWASLLNFAAFGGANSRECPC